MFFSFLKKESQSLSNGGFVPLNGKGINLEYDLSNKLPNKNKDYEFIKLLCKKNDINLIVVNTPM